MNKFSKKVLIFLSIFVGFLSFGFGLNQQILDVFEQYETKLINKGYTEIQLEKRFVDIEKKVVILVNKYPKNKQVLQIKEVVEYMIDKYSTNSGTDSTKSSSNLVRYEQGYKQEESTILEDKIVGKFSKSVSEIIDKIYKKHGVKVYLDDKSYLIGDYDIDSKTMQVPEDKLILILKEIDISLDKYTNKQVLNKFLDKINLLDSFSISDVAYGGTMSKKNKAIFVVTYTNDPIFVSQTIHHELTHLIINIHDEYNPFVKFLSKDFKSLNIEGFEYLDGGFNFLKDNDSSKYYLSAVGSGFITEYSKSDRGEDIATIMGEYLVDDSDRETKYASSDILQNKLDLILSYYKTIGLIGYDNSQTMLGNYSKRFYPQKIDETNYNKYYELGKKHYDDSDFKQAIVNFLKAKEYYYDSALIYYIGLSYFYNDEFSKAKPYFDLYYEFNPYDQYIQYYISTTDSKIGE